MLPFIFLSLLTNLLTPAPVEDELMLCKCFIEKELSDDGVYKKRDVYVYLVRGTNGFDCCEKRPEKGYKGFHETWLNEAPKHPGVWRMTDSVPQRISAKKARRISCKAPEKELVIMFKKHFKEGTGFERYYPELVK